PFHEVLSLMQDKSVEYYYYVPNERNHPILSRLGIHQHLSVHFEELYRAGDRVLYRIKSTP
ncbi:MAG TPA: hypothetical protein PKH07_12615, partial [bacterium]|nr:hypothetical protein [bacterium]